MAKQSFTTQLAKGFVRSAVNQMGREAGRAASNKAYRNTNYYNVRGANSSLGYDYTNVGAYNVSDDTRILPPVKFGGGYWVLFVLANIFTLGLAGLVYLIYGFATYNKRLVKTNRGIRVQAPDYIINIYKETGKTIMIASAITLALFIMQVILTNKLPVETHYGIICSATLLFFASLIGLAIWGTRSVNNAYDREIARLQEIHRDLVAKQKAAEEEELDRKAKAFLDSMPVVPRYEPGCTNQEFRAQIAGLGHHHPYYGGFAGYIIPEPNNPHDQNAMAIYVADKKIGYVPRRDNIHYKDWCNNRPMPCIGCIYYNDGKDVGVVRAIRYTNPETMYRIANDFFAWFRDNGHGDLAPDELHFCVKVEPTEEGGAIQMI